tara:strand:- start:7757 stop:8026 length:270 start_codon:yes stop_codon:yes gene_type:complete
MSSEIRIGDLICYNAAGQKKKTLGLVLDIRSDEYSIGANIKNVLLVQWCCIGNGILPRKGFTSFDFNREKIQPGSLVWHEIGDWFEVVN